MKKLTLHSEICYLLGLILISLAVAMVTTTDFGLSMIVAPAYIISLKLGITFGQAEYIVQGILFVIFCIIMKGFKIKYLFSFITGLIYGLFLDFWMLVIPHFNPGITAPGSLPLYLNIIYFVLGELLTAFSVSLFFRSYIPPQVYDYFVKGISDKYTKVNRRILKIVFDYSFLLLGVILTLVLFNFRFVGVGVATLVMCLINGPLISLFDKILCKFFDIKPLFKKAGDFFEIKEEKEEEDGAGKVH